MYRYFGLLLGHAKATVALLQVSGLVAGAHSAVWLGASNPAATSWVQAGIETSYGDTRNYVYIEIGARGRQVFIQEWPVGYYHIANVQVFNRGSYWRVKVGGHSSRWVWLQSGLTVTVLEDYSPGPVSSVALIGDKLVKGR